MKLKHIDSLRGTAILLVILVHTAQSVKGISLPLSVFAEYGQMGVQLFFIVSAYTLCLSAERRQEERLKNINFFIRRFFRIAPLYYSGILFYILWAVVKGYINSGYLVLPEQYNFLNILTNLLFVHGFYPPANNNIAPGGWSIGTEMAFYACFPLIYPVAKRITSCGLLSLLMLPLLALILNIFIQSSTGQKAEINNFIYFNLVNQMPVFLIGIVLFQSERLGYLRSLSWKNDVLGFSFFTIASMAVWRSGVPYTFALVPFISGISFVFLYDLLLKNSWLNNTLIVTLGKVSFSAYIFHFLFAWGLSRSLYTRLHEIVSSDVLLLICLTTTVCLSYGVAIITEDIIEKRGVSWGHQLIKTIENKSAKPHRKGNLENDAAELQ